MTNKTTIAVLTLLLATLNLLGNEVSEAQAVRAMVGEASNQGYTGLLAVGNVIRHRGSIKGLCGAKAAHCDREPAWVWILARKAWAESATNDVTMNSTHFENVSKFGRPVWARSMTKTVKIKDHQFYK
jgi:hypothetical protein